MTENEVQEVEQESLPGDNQNELFSLIQNIQAKLNSDDEVLKGNTSTYEKNVEDVQKNVEEQVSNNESNSNESPFASILQNLDISAILKGLTNNSGNNNNNSEDSGFSFGNIDINTISRIQKIISSMKKDDPKKNLLLSLKPFLRKSRQDKLSEYITILTIVNAIGIFDKDDRKGSD